MEFGKKILAKIDNVLAEGSKYYPEPGKPPVEGGPFAPKSLKELISIITNLPADLSAGLCCGFMAGLGGGTLAIAKSPARMQNQTYRIGELAFLKAVPDTGYHPEGTKAMMTGHGQTILLSERQFDATQGVAAYIAQIVKRPAPRIEDLSRLQPAIE